MSGLNLGSLTVTPTGAIGQVLIRRILARPIRLVSLTALPISPLPSVPRHGLLSVRPIVISVPFFLGYGRLPITYIGSGYPCNRR